MNVYVDHVRLDFVAVRWDGKEQHATHKVTTDEGFLRSKTTFYNKLTFPLPTCQQ